MHRFSNQGHSDVPHSTKYKSHQKWLHKFKLFTTELYQVNSKLISSKFQQKQSKDKELREEVNTNYLRIFFFFWSLQEKLKYKSSIIQTSGPPVGRSFRPTPREATLIVSFLTCIKPRFLLPVLKFNISNSLLQGSCVGLNSCHLIVLKNHQETDVKFITVVFRPLKNTIGLTYEFSQVITQSN